MDDQVLHELYVCECVCETAERYEVHLRRAPVTDVHGNVK